MNFGPDSDLFLRLLAAVVVGMLIGVNRDLHGKPTGVRTLGLVSLGAALTALATAHLPIFEGHPDAQSRVIQGVLQGVLVGIGFLGAGVIVRDAEGKSVHNLTTAATVWVTATLGMVCALSSWTIIVMGVFFTLVILMFGGPLERFLEKVAPRHKPPPSEN